MVVECRDRPEPSLMRVRLQSQRHAQLCFVTWKGIPVTGSRHRCHTGRQCAALRVVPTPCTASPCCSPSSMKQCVGAVGTRWACLVHSSLKHFSLLLHVCSFSKSATLLGLQNKIVTLQVFQTVMCFLCTRHDVHCETRRTSTALQDR